jgi:hypothetical protein
VRARPARIASHGELYARLGRPASADALAALRACVDRLGDGLEAQALANAFALHPEGATDRRLAGRRTTFSRRTGLLPDDVERYEAAAINQLVDMLNEPST